MTTRATMLHPMNAIPATSAAPRLRRRITPQAGKGLELLAHALEYLTDEYVVSAASGSSLEGRMEAIELLKSLNRRIYMECAEIPRTRVGAFLRRCFG